MTCAPLGLSHFELEQKKPLSFVHKQAIANGCEQSNCMDAVFAADLCVDKTKPGLQNGRTRVHTHSPGHVKGVISCIFSFLAVP